MLVNIRDRFNVPFILKKYFILKKFILSPLVQFKVIFKREVAKALCENVVERFNAVRKTSKRPKCLETHHKKLQKQPGILKAKIFGHG